MLYLEDVVEIFIDDSCDHLGAEPEQLYSLDYNDYEGVRNILFDELTGI